MDKGRQPLYNGCTPQKLEKDNLSTENKIAATSPTPHTHTLHVVAAKTCLMGGFCFSLESQPLFEALVYYITSTLHAIPVLYLPLTCSWEWLDPFIVTSTSLSSW